MDKLVLVDSIESAIGVLGESVAQPVRIYGEARGKAERSGVKAGKALFEAEYKSQWLVSPYTQGGKPKPEVAKEDEVCMLHGEAFTRYQVFDAVKLILAEAYMTAADFETWSTPPEKLESAVEKAARTLLVRDLGGVISDVRKSIAGYERKAAQKAAQEAENAAAEAEGREAVDVNAGKDSSGKSEEVRIAERAVAQIKIAQQSTEPDYDATEVVKLARAILVVVGQPDPTQEA